MSNNINTESMSKRKTVCSIIIPVYNAEKTLKRCLDSLLCQTLGDFEIIAVDDGSTDKSSLILDEYANKDGRIKVIHKENGGVSSARNVGMKHAQGQYTIHVDSDDWVEPNMLEELVDYAEGEKADIVICDFYMNRIDGQTYCTQTPENLSPDTIIRQLLFQQLYGTCWNKLIKRTMYTESISFPMDIHWSEDFWVIIQMLKNNPNVVYLPKAYYHYDFYSNNNSLTRIKAQIRISRVESFLDRLKGILPEEEYKDGYIYQYSRLLKNYLDSDINHSSLSLKISYLESYGCCKYLSKKEIVKLIVRKNHCLDYVYRIYKKMKSSI